ncbi:MAG: hypothetical protein ACTS5F_00845 [Candidatus Hodgkinia cicadicola]
MGRALEAKTWETTAGEDLWSQRITSSPLLKMDKIKDWKRARTLKPNVKVDGDTLQSLAMAALDAASTASGLLSNEVRGAAAEALRRVKGELGSVWRFIGEIWNKLETRKTFIRNEMKGWRKVD